MTRLIPGALTLIACAALVLAGFQMSKAWTLWRAGPSALPQAEIAMTKPESGETIATAGEARRWLPIFGVPRRDLREQGAQAASRFDYELKGVVATGNMRWAILTGAGGDLLVREGDVLDEDGSEVIKIHAEGLDLRLPDGIVSLGFAADSPVAVQRIEPEETAEPEDAPRLTTMLPPAEATEVIFQNLSADEVLAILQKAEAQRRAKGIGLAKE